MRPRYAAIRTIVLFLTLSGLWIPLSAYSIPTNSDVHPYVSVHSEALAAVLFYPGPDVSASDALHVRSEALWGSVLDTNLEALAGPGSLQEEFHDLTIRLQRRLLEGRGINEELAEMPAEALYQYRDYVLGKVAQDPDFDAWEAHFEWQSFAALVYHIDPDTYQDRLKSRAVRIAEHYFSVSGRAFSTDSSGLPRYLRALALDVYKTLIVSAPGVTDVCAGYLQEIEDAFKRLATDELRDLIRKEQDVIFDQIEKRRKEASQWLAVRVKGDNRFHQSRGTYIYKSAIEGKYRKWFVELDTIFPGAGYEGFLTFRSKHDVNIATTIRSDAFVDLLAAGGIDSLLHEATEQALLVGRDGNALSQYDLPDEGRSAYLRLLPKSFGSAEFGFLLSSMARSAAFAHRYGERLSHTEVIFTNALEDSLATALERMKGKGISSVIVEFNSHGVEGGFKYGETPLSPEAITRLIAANPDVKFLLRTPACYGGKLRDALLTETDKDNSLHSRVTFFSQSKPDTPNILYYGSLLDVSVYDIFLLQNLLDTEIKSYGEAAGRADKMTRRVYWTNAEAVYQGRLME